MSVCASWTNQSTWACHARGTTTKSTTQSDSPSVLRRFSSSPLECAGDYVFKHQHRFCINALDHVHSCSRKFIERQPQPYLHLKHFSLYIFPRGMSLMKHMILSSKMCPCCLSGTPHIMVFPSCELKSTIHIRQYFVVTVPMKCFRQPRSPVMLSQTYLCPCPPD